MPFDLRLHYVPINGGAPWTMEGPGWLSNAPLPFDKACVRELVDNSLGRDRYMPVSAEELLAWTGKVMVETPSEKRGEVYGSRYDEFMGHVGKASASSMYLLHWYEWESGMN